MRISVYFLFKTGGERCSEMFEMTNEGYMWRLPYNTDRWWIVCLMGNARTWHRLPPHGECAFSRECVMMYRWHTNTYECGGIVFTPRDRIWRMWVTRICYPLMLWLCNSIALGNMTSIWTRLYAVLKIYGISAFWFLTWQGYRFSRQTFWKQYTDT